MPGARIPLTPDERSWRVPGPQAQRTFAVGVVTELATVLEPVVRDPFLDGVDEQPQPARLTPPLQGVAPHAPSVRAAAYATA